MRFRYFLAAAMSVAAFTASADTANPMYMVVSITDGALKVINVDAVDRITFDSSATNPAMKATDNTGAAIVEFPLSTISSIEFNENGEAGIQSVTTDSKIAYDAQSAILHIRNAVKGSNLCIYDMGGHLVLSTPIDNTDTTIDIAQLISGVYLVKLSDVTLKISKK